MSSRRIVTDPFYIHGVHADLAHSPNSDVKDVAADGGADRHVSESFPRHDHGGDEVRDRGPGCQEGQSHHLETHAC